VVADNGQPEMAAVGPQTEEREGGEREEREAESVRERMQENREEKRKERKKEKEGRRRKEVGGWPADQPVAMGGSPCPKQKKRECNSSYSGSFGG